jgi:pimeloyl-ACP methyl ester carboxylesterase
MFNKSLLLFVTSISFLFATVTQTVAAPLEKTPLPASSVQVSYHTLTANGLEIFYREAGNPKRPTILLLHGFPTSSHMFRELIPQLADRYHIIAPDYPGFGQSNMPSRDAFAYTFENITNSIEVLTRSLGLNRYALYVMDYGAPVGYLLASRHPEQVTALIIQNGNGYEEGLQQFWDQFRTYWTDPSQQNRDALRGLLTLETTKFQYLDGVPNTMLVSPDTWTHDQALLDRQGNNEIQLDLFLDYRENVARYPIFHEYFRKYQPPTLITWGKNDFIFPAEGALAFLQDLPNAELHLLNTGHFALETHGAEIAKLIRNFLGRKLKLRT